MGVVMGLGSAVITYFWKGDPLVSVVIFIAMVLNFIMAVIVGSIIPILLSFFRRDPAVGEWSDCDYDYRYFWFFYLLGHSSLWSCFIWSKLIIFLFAFELSDNCFAGLRCFLHNIFSCLS